MDIEIIINGERMDYSHSSDVRLRQRILAFQDSGKPLQIILYIVSQGVDLALGYPRDSLDDDTSIKHRPLYPLEREIVDDWDRCGLSSRDFNVDRLIEFLHLIKP